ncbi:MAG: anhydro-N-acetylmuramic acid kinase [Armatimonadota bacterium]|nr:anhydro-N-acetylmuramic acid kinase [Armatimonadota bacterium]MDR7426328.1 anhydro-N-acetylmuramic acid kinase [Armatimonadota bacterium]MDR7463245.1 anhydro-N-acetylmuramic acid kinase [Armatimonadota bacterium]MDR7469188.1 anhydro-N-acetylmuramic acid kinase [Armatimonadota bacterium]MDR7474747.1 anhydro-N-acetylmuramic acid kinase [Armatimonadota bacterium]
MSWLARLLEALADKPSRTVIGLISGTSADAADAAGVEISEAGEQARVQVRLTLAKPYPAGLGERLRALTEGGSARRRFIFPRHVPDGVVVSGGGVHNATLMARLARALAPLPLRTTSGLGVDSDAREAIAFAILAHGAVMGLATSVPGATGARHPVVLGAIYPGPLPPARRRPGALTRPQTPG